MVPDRT